MAISLQKLYKRDYTDRVKDFASYLEGSNISLSDTTVMLTPMDTHRSLVLELAEDPQDEGLSGTTKTVISAYVATKMANKLVDSWTWPARRIADLTTSTANLYGRIMRWALRDQIDSTGFEERPDTDAVDSHINEHAENLALSTHETLRNEMRTAVRDALQAGHTDPKDIAREVREHFSERPASKSETLAITETVDAYNTATLMLGEANDVKQVQALDAQKGPTDRDCEERDGKLFKLRDAFREDSKERHPRCTLEWRLLKPEVEVGFSRGEEMPPDEYARWDAAAQIVHLSDTITHAEEKRWMLSLGNELAAAA